MQKIKNTSKQKYIQTKPKLTIPVYQGKLLKNFPFTYTPKHLKSCTKVCNNHTIAKNFYFFQLFRRS